MIREDGFHRLRRGLSAYIDLPEWAA